MYRVFFCVAKVDLRDGVVDHFTLLSLYVTLMLRKHLSFFPSKV